MNRTRLFVLPGLAVVAIFLGLLATCATSALGAQLIGDGSAWARSIELHAPGPAGPPITVKFEACPSNIGAGGCWSPWDSTIHIDSKYSPEFVYAHELGHAFDTRNLSGRERAWFLSVFGHDQATWTPNRPVDDPYCLRMRCPEEVFANVYALCALGLRHHVYYGAKDAVFWGRHASMSFVGYGMRLEASVLKQGCRAISTFKDPA